MSWAIYGGGKLFDKAASDALIQQGQDFSTLPSITAGARAIAESVNYPLSVLQARYDAISAERDDFLARMELFLSVLEQDSNAVDQLLYAAEMETWSALQPQVSGATKFGYDLSSTHGEVAGGVSMADPLTGAVCLDSLGLYRQPSDVSFLVNGELVHGIGSMVVSVDRIAPINLQWDCPAAGEVENLVGPDWTKYSLLAPGPLLHFGQPTATVILPKSLAKTVVLHVKGQQVAGNLPVYVKIVFVPRRRKVTIADCVDAVARELSAYRISGDDIIVYDDLQSYEQGQDYTIDLTVGRRDLVPLTSLAGKTVNVQVTEYFPAYQCSTNNMDWSPAVMFDAVTPFADVRKNYFPIEIPGDGWFPVVDELGSPLGIWIKPTESGLDSECQLRIETLASADFGATAVLEVEFDRPGYYNGLRLTPFVNMPIHLTKIIADGMFTSNDSPVFQGDALIDRPVSIRFADVNGDPVYVRRLFLTLYQPNYSLEEHFVNPADQLRQDSLARLQSVLPFSDRPVQASLPTRLTGAQYEFGLSNIAGERYNPVQTVRAPGAAYAPPKGVFVSGPFAIDGMPEVIRLDADITGDVDCFLVCRPYGVGGAVLGDSDHVIQQLQPGTALSFPDAWAGGTLTKADLFLKWVFRSDDAVLTRFLLQVTKGA